MRQCAFLLQRQVGSFYNPCLYLSPRNLRERRNFFLPPSAKTPGLSLSQGIFWREVCAGGAKIDEHQIPAGYDVGTGIYAIHHNPVYFPCPFDFIPERWLLPLSSSSSKLLPFPVTEASISLGRSAFIPFSTGPRVCVARSLAYLEMTLTVATVLWAAELKVADGEQGRLGEGGWGNAKEALRSRKGEYQLWDQITSAKDGPLLCFRLRNESNAAWKEYVET